MAGLAATIGAESPAPANAIADALAPRGPDAASWRAGGVHLVTRAALPVVAESAGRALIVDGVAEANSLALRYAGQGPAALAHGPDPYALVLADPARDALVLARNGDGPPLYWAMHGGSVLVASEPAALLAAGVPAEPDPAVTRRFLDHAVCDDSAATFLAAVRRVLPGQVVDVRQDPAARTFTVRTHETAPAEGGTAAQALAAACGTGRVGVRLTAGYAGAAALGTAMSRCGRAEVLPVYSATMPELSGNFGAAAVLGPLSRGAVRHRALPFFTDEIDIDGLLREVGEPLPELDDWLLWALARRVAGDVDTLLEPARTGTHLSRLTDRVASRYGITIRTPMRDVAASGSSLRAELVALAGRTLPSGCVIDERPSDTSVRGVLAQLRSPLIATFLQRRGALADTLALLGGGRVDADRLWRQYVLERWARMLARPIRPPRPYRLAGGPPRAGKHPAIAPAQEHPIAGWRRVPVRTDVLAADDKIPERIAWYVGEVAGGVVGDRPWFAVVAAKPLAVLQGRARALWQIRPGWTARLAHRLAGRTRLGDPWTMQVAVEEAGRSRMALAVVAAACGVAGWYDQLTGAQVRAVRGPRADAVSPADVSVVPAPTEPERLAAAVTAALRTSLPDAMHASFGGSAVVSEEVLAFAPRPGAPPPPPGLLEAVGAAPQEAEFIPFEVVTRDT